MNKLILICFYLLISCGSKQLKFDKSKWNESFDGFYQYRENMVEDLINNHLKKGMSYEQLIDLIGNPEVKLDSKKGEIEYLILEDYGWDIDPVETKKLKIEISKDSLVLDYKIKHWKYFK